MHLACESHLCGLLFILPGPMLACRTGLFAGACRGRSCHLVAAFDVDVYVSFVGRLEGGRFVSVKKGRRIINKGWSDEEGDINDDGGGDDNDDDGELTCFFFLVF